MSKLGKKNKASKEAQEKQLKQQLAAANDVREVVKWMACLNREASQLAVAAGVKSGTDVTGYSLLRRVA